MNGIHTERDVCRCRNWTVSQFTLLVQAQRSHAIVRETQGWCQRKKASTFGRTSRAGSGHFRHVHDAAWFRPHDLWI